MTAQNHLASPYQLQSQCANLADGLSQSMKRPRTLLDSQSHRVIEKRRRDRMNNCLADLGQLVSDVSESTGVKHPSPGRIKKTEIIEMAIDRIRGLQAQLRANQVRADDRLLTGFKECRDVAIRYLVEHHGHDIVGPLCTGMIVHLHEHLHSICRVATVSQTTGVSTDTAGEVSLAHSSSVATPAVTMGLPSGKVEDQNRQESNQVYVKPETNSPNATALGDSVDPLNHVNKNPSSALPVQPRPRVLMARSQHRRLSEAASGIGSTKLDEETDEASNDDDEEYDRSGILLTSQRRQFQTNGAYKYKDCIKRRFCSESDARSWNESASDCSSTIGSRYESVDLSGNDMAGAGGGTEVGPAHAQATISPSTSPNDQLDPNQSTTPQKSLSSTLSPLKAISTKSKLELRFAQNSAARCSCNCNMPTGSLPVARSPGFVLHRSGAYYVPIFVSSWGVWRHPAESSQSPQDCGIKANDGGSGGSGCDDVEEDDVDDETSTASEQPSEVVCHPVSVPVNFSSGFVPVICGCLAASQGKESGAQRRWMRLNLATSSSVSYPINVNSVSGSTTSFPSAPVLLQRL